MSRALAFLLALPLAAPRADTRVPPDFDRDVAPLFVRHCLDCPGGPPPPRADRRPLIRRLSFDLRGLPPTPEEVGAFLGDSRPDAYECLVDRLLASPHYGERWGRHWLDVVRFGESDGFERDLPRQSA